VGARFLEGFSSSLGASLPRKPRLEVALHLHEGIELRNVSVDPSWETWVMWGFSFLLASYYSGKQCLQNVGSTQHERAIALFLRSPFSFCACVNTQRMRFRDECGKVVFE